MPKKKKRKSNYKIRKKKRRKTNIQKNKLTLEPYKSEGSNIDFGPEPPREILPVENLTVNQYIDKVVRSDSFFINHLKKIRVEKANGKRPKPSTRLIGNAILPNLNIQHFILDRVALLVDENIWGRSEMCIQFSSLLALALRELGFDAKAYQGKAQYKKGEDWFTWNHSWVIYDDFIIDGNTDSMIENPMVASGIDPDPFWGKVSSIPEDRKFDFNSAEIVKPDEDTKMWWIELLQTIIHNMNSQTTK